MTARLIDLESARAARLPVARFGQLAVEGGMVVVTFPAGNVVRLTPSAARTWADAILMLAGVAEAEGRP